MTPSRIAAVVLLQLLCTAASYSATPVFREEIQKQTGIYDSRGEDTPEGYVTGRSLLSYSYLLPTAFVRSLGDLGPADRWLDVGAGEGRAVLDYATSKYEALFQGATPHGGKARAVAISIEDRRTSHWHQTAASLEANQVQYFFGRRLREYPPEELGRFQLITDVLGAFSYTRYPSVFMQKALGLLEVNGSLYTLLQDVHWADGQNRPYYPDARFLTEIAKADGSEMKVCSWLKSISCVQVTCETKADIKPPIEVYRVQKICNEVRVPGMDMVHFASGTPPERGFRLTDSQPGSLLREEAVR